MARRIDPERSPSADSKVELWNSRADAYATLCRRWDLFTVFADRLIADVDRWLERDGAVAATVLDVGAGTGLVAKRFLRIHPAARVVMVEPARRLREIARADLSEDSTSGAGVSRVTFVPSRVEDLGSKELDLESLAADAALSSAVWHLVDEARAFAAVSFHLRSGACFALNLWWHSWDDIADRDPQVTWREVLERSLRCRGLRSGCIEGAPRPSPRTRSMTLAHAERAGLEWIGASVDEDRVAERFFLEFRTMDSTFLEDVEPRLRKEVIAETMECLTGDVMVATQRIVFRKK